MKVHVVCHGLFGIVRPAEGDGIEAVFLDAAGWKDPHFHIPPHDLFVRYTASDGEAKSQLLTRPADLELSGMPAGRTRIESQPVSLGAVLGAARLELSEACGTGQSASCRLNARPLVRARLALRGGTLRTCEFHPVHGLDFGASRGGWGSQHLDYEWTDAGGRAQFVSKTQNAVLFSFEAEGQPELRIGGEARRLGAASEATRLRLPEELGKKYALITLNNTVPSPLSGAGHLHMEPNRDTHSLLFHEMLAAPLAVDRRPIPRLRFPVAAELEAPPLSRCIPYTYQL